MREHQCSVPEGRTAGVCCPAGQSVLWALYVRLEKAYSQGFKRFVEDSGLSVMENKVLWALDSDPSLHTAADLVRNHKMAKSHVSLAVKALTEKGYLTQSAGAGRCIHLQCTPAAQQLVERGRTDMQALYQQIYRGFSQEEQSQLTGLLERMAENLKGGQETGYGEGISEE